MLDLADKVFILFMLFLLFVFIIAIFGNEQNEYKINTYEVICDNHIIVYGITEDKQEIHFYSCKELEANNEL